MEEGVEETCHSILCPSFGPVGKLLGVQLQSDAGRVAFSISFSRHFMNIEASVTGQ